MAPSKVTKKRSDSSKHPIQYWDGKTYACMACKRGHRVKLCDHAKDGKLVSATNQPGRPSSGSDRKCTCPKSCKCTTNCKCVKDGCLCVQKMFLVVALKSNNEPMSNSQDPEPIPQWIDENGEQKTLNAVYTDMNGNVLSAEEAKAREEERERRRNDGTAQPHKPSCCSSKQVKEETTGAPTPGCRQRDAMPQTPAPEKTQVSHSTQSSNKCTCGVKCQCTLCPEHPNNTATREYNAQQLTAMANNPGGSYMPTHSMINGQLFKPAVPQGSCLGGEASYFLTREQPTLHDFQRLFPDYAPGDFVLTYPMDAPRRRYNQMNNMASPEHATFANTTFTPIAMSMNSIPDVLDLQNDTFDNMTFLDQPLNYTFGDADVTTFGAHPIQSPPLQHSPTLNQTSPNDLSDPSRHRIPFAISASQTVNPDFLNARSSCCSQHLTLDPTPSPAHTEGIDRNLFLDDALPSLPEEQSFDMMTLPSSFSGSQVFEYAHSQPLNPSLSFPYP